MLPKPVTENTLFDGNNPPVLRECIAAESVDLVCPNRPFNLHRKPDVDDRTPEELVDIIAAKGQ